MHCRQSMKDDFIEQRFDRVGTECEELRRSQARICQKISLITRMGPGV